MARYILCDRCKALIEYNPVIVHNNMGIIFRRLICPECGYIKESNENNIHYGNDGRK